MEESARKAGHELPFQDLDELAQVALEGIRDERFVIMIDVGSIGPTLRARADQLEEGALPEPHKLGAR